MTDTQSPPLFLTLADDSWQRVYHAFVLAAGALALERKVVLFAGGKSVLALTRTADRLPDQPAEEEMRRKALPTLLELRTACLDLGMRLLACESGMRLAGLSPDDLCESVEVGGVVEFLVQAGTRPITAL
ncbi:DsrE/DsrF/DrsH-like family protein [Oecophyllibacter saccharovorans]|uniref:DsrE/DsrF/DrsH-like family protein n=1 Tax=Oecophyllibacter saccharovorans TaxID=2558360 RepID=UPI001174A4C8|nr:DsrE/DsrF/DrsH-like family protein [Oecophyllibacter saccharovorans]TPW34680.1 hypothetical protein E3203_03795 [Oecophyllibacter saccharovorans]